MARFHCSLVWWLWFLWVGVGDCVGSVDGGDWIRILTLVGLMLVVVVRVGWLGFGLMAVGWLGGGGSGLCG